jgi:RNA polymerase sigma-70 factor (ECF subfamily)
LQRPPRDRSRPWRPWLTRVALNVGRDLLRKRRRRRYEGPWLPEILPTGEETSPPSFEPREAGPGARYDRLESVSLAFLLALEALTPAQRAVLLLRDVFDYAVRETAEALDLSEANVKTTHLRARRAMEAYDRERCVPTPPTQAPRTSVPSPTAAGSSTLRSCRSSAARRSRGSSSVSPHSPAPRNASNR